MALFFKSLSKKLDRERPNWRKDTVFLIDNAPYHKSKGILEEFDAQKLPIMYTGTHSYDAVPVELWFAAFKSRDVNPNRVKTGKR